MEAVVVEVTRSSEAFQREMQLLRNQATEARTALAASAATVQSIQRTVQEVSAEADRLRVLAGGVSGIALGLTIGLSTGASGSGIALYAAGGAAVGVGTACIYNAAK
jgi:hypothetical protein